MTGRELALGSSFSLTGETAGGGTAALWGRGAVSGFDGREGELILDGEVTTGLLGADFANGRWLLGLIASHSRGEGSYRGAGAGTVSSTLTGVHPWARYAMSERFSVWGAAGYGAGTLALDPDGEDAGERAMQADLTLALAALGARGELLERPGDAGGPGLALVSDAMFVRTESESTRGLAAASADVTRLRLALDGSWRFALAQDVALTPSLELGVRHDGGDAETGFGVDIGGGLAFADLRRGLSMELNARTLLAHERVRVPRARPHGGALLRPAPVHRPRSDAVLAPDPGGGVDGRGGRAAGPRDPDRARGQRQFRRATPGAHGGLRHRDVRRALHGHAGDRRRAFGHRPRLPPRLAARARLQRRHLLRARAGGDAARRARTTMRIRSTRPACGSARGGRRRWRGPAPAQAPGAARSAPYARVTFHSTPRGGRDDVFCRG